MMGYTYCVLDEHEGMVATEMRLEDALLLVKAMMQEYYSEPSIRLTILRNAPKEAHDGE